MQHELLLALLGHPGDVFETRGDGFFVQRGTTLLSDPQKTMVNQLLRLGFAFVMLERFTKSAQTLPSMYVRAIAQGMEDVLAQYEDKVIGIEATVLSTGIVLPIPQMVCELEQYFEVLPELCKLVRKIEPEHANEHAHGRFGGARILDIVHRCTLSGFPRVRECMLHLQQCAHRILFKQVISWILFGEIVDPFGEFFIRQTRHSTTMEQKSRMGEPEWLNASAIDLEAIPLSYFPISIAESIFFIGKSMRILMKAQEVTEKEAKEVVRNVASIAVASEFNANALEQAVEQVRHHVAHRLYTEVVVKSDFVGFLYALKNHFLLSRGELFQTFIERSFALMGSKPTAKTNDDVNHGVWPQLRRDLQVDDEPFGKCFLWHIPLQSFHVKGFMNRDGMIMSGLATDAASKWLEQKAPILARDVPEGHTFPSSGQTTGTVWWKHVQLDNSGLCCEFDVQVGYDGPPSRQLALVFQNNDTFNTPQRDGGGWKTASPEKGLAVVECDIEPTTIEQVAVNCRVYSSTLSSTATHKALVMMRNDQSVQIQVFSTRVESAGAMGQATPVRGIVVVANGTIVLYEPFDMGNALSLHTTNGEYWLGLTFGAGIRLHEWRLDRFSSKAVIKQDSKRKELHQSWTPRELWNSLGLSCDVQWPLQLLVSQDLLRCYNHLFQFFFRLKRASHAVELTWKCAVLRSKTSNDAQMVACVLRGRMGFVLRNLSLYYQVFVVESTFTKFLRDVESSTDFEKVKRMHESMVASLIKQCYVHTRTVMSAMDDVLSCCWAFAEYMLHQDSLALPLSVDRLLLLKQEFTASFDFLHGVLQHSDARDLIVLLDFNAFFSTGHRA
ncbi:TPA: hypothetical protein N0F65_010877 [Lagenidium giganteum]|uniref:Spindle pole body component n=1 Tax=Lagenidium giganteum TaxID=4803 RepID=A0AAV2YGW6_9STRA|nr:TPA: hypothetical protein N0F65_004904 [Lagenidium giganteum]DAZ93028.1 TPA: hypothetical protein N0F65_012986 [Lagenidium giganteum]DAZ94280.1 TPA: hypothetical protein N0F65_010877 [Lagenidium giganteum]